MYHITTQKLGSGGFGSVFLGYQLSTKNDNNNPVAVPVAIKVLENSNPGAKERFEREQEIMKMLERILPKGSFVPLLFSGNVDGKPCYVMPHYKQGSLETQLSGKSLPALNALSIIKSIAKALEKVHAVGIIHNDLKEGNILLSNDGLPLISDWGLAFVEDEKKLTSDGAAPGTHGYRAPEIGTKDARKNATADIYSLGVILDNISAPHTEVAELVAMMTEPEPKNRIQDCEELLEAISLARQNIQEQKKKKALRLALQEMESSQRQELSQRERNDGQNNILGIIVAGLFAWYIFKQ